jgi:hypothetical protein
METAPKPKKNIDKLRNKTQALYGEIGETYCPALKGKVHFSAEGFNHLLYSGKRERTADIQEVKLQLVRFVNELISTTATIQEQDERQEMVHKKRYKKLSKEWSVIRYWGFVAIIRNKRIKVVIRQVDKGPYHFWSVMPAWRTNRFQGHRVVNHAKGSLAND